MTGEDQIMRGFRDAYNKLVWLNNLKMKDRFGDYTSSEVHCIECIGRNPDCNVTKLAEAFFMTRGAISKMTKKLQQKGAVESYQKPDNKKEIYFQLTPQGQQLFATHESLHNEFSRRDQVVFETMSEEQLEGILRFLDAYNTHLDALIHTQGGKPRATSF